MFVYLDAPETALNGRAVRGLLRDKQKIKLLSDAQRKKWKWRWYITVPPEGEWYREK